MDDHAEVRAVLVALVVRFWPDATVVEVRDGAEALRAVSQYYPDLIITDYQMPVMSGLELVRALRAQGETISILVLSSDTSIADRFWGMVRPPFCPSRFHSLRRGRCCTGSCHKTKHPRP